MPPKPPNILWIVTTQWRAQSCGYAGDPNARTPCLDAFAAEAIDFAQAVTPHPFGPFARAALLTGRPSPENGVRDYFDPLPENAPTIARELRGRGYVTAFFGKWHLANRDPNAALVGDTHARRVVSPEARGGFDVWDGFESGFLLNDPWLHGHRSQIPERVSGYQSDVVCSRAADFLQGKSTGVESPPGRPWFVVVSLEAPHPPYDAPAAGIFPRDPAALELPANVPRGGEVEARARRELAGYYAHIEATDRAIGRLLRRHGQAPETAVVVTSVHGDMHGAHGKFRKGWPYEESVRVPLLVKPPAASGVRAAGSRSDALVSLLDVPRWARAWSGGGDSYRTTEYDGAATQQISMPSVVALPHQCDRVWRGVRTSTRKLVLNADRSPWLFFDLERDPGETRNLAAAPGRADEIAALAAQVSA